MRNDSDHEHLIFGTPSQASAGRDANKPPPRTHPHGGASVPPLPSAPVAVGSGSIEMVIAAPTPPLNSISMEKKKREDRDGPEDQDPDEGGGLPLQPTKPPQSPSTQKNLIFNDLNKFDSREVNDSGYRYPTPSWRHESNKNVIPRGPTLFSPWIEKCGGYIVNFPDLSP